MSFYTYKNILIKLNNNYLICSDVQISTQANISPKHLSEERHSFDYAADSPVNGSLKLTYLLTGNDFLRSFISDDTTISGNFGGLYFNSGYLKSYSINGTPNSPINVNSEIVFFEPLGGTFNSSAPYSFTGHALNFSDATLTTTAIGCEALGNVISCNYNYQSALEPNYYREDRNNLYSVTPNDVRFGAKQITLDIVSDNLSGNSPLEGSNASISLNFNHPYVQNITDNLTLSGKIFQKNISTSSNNIIKNNISLRQDYIEAPPTITSIVPSTQLAGSNVVINGTNLTPAIYTYFGSDKAAILSSSSTSLTVRVPYNAISSNVYVKTYGGRISGGYFAVTYPPISIYKIDPITGREDDNILISGTNFYRINKVRFGSGNDIYNASFMNINTGIINAKVPRSGIWSQIHVISDDRNKTGVSTLKFVPFPRIDSITPQTGAPGTTFRITGYNFSGVTSASFSGILTSSVGILGNTILITTIPTGGTRDFIKITGPSGVSSFSNTKYQPVLFIDSISPSNGRPGNAISIIGSNFAAPIMFSGIPANAASTIKGFKVEFNGGITGFELVSSTLLQGLLPYDAKSGPVYIYAENDSQYNSTGAFTVNNDSPTIQRRLSDQVAIFPFTVVSGQNIDSYILGKNFFNISRVILSGSGQNNTNFLNDVPAANYNIDVLGTVVNIINYSTVGLLSGQYSILVSGTAGLAVARSGDSPFIITSGLDWNNPNISPYIPLNA